jgi:hypothetical protein
MDEIQALRSATNSSQFCEFFETFARNEETSFEAMKGVQSRKAFRLLGINFS